MNLATIYVIGKQTLYSYARDRIFHSSLVFSALFVLFSFLISTLTLVEPQKLLLDFGLSAISMAGIAISLFLGNTVVGKEIEKRTIYTILSKPISRTEYLIGKFLGCTLVIIFVHIANMATLSLVLYNVGEPFPAGFLACGYLMVLESLLVLAISLFLSIYTSSLLLATSLSIAFFLIGRSSQSLQGMIKKSSSAGSKAVVKILYDIFPSLDRFNIREVVAYSKPYPSGMIQMSTLYFFAYLALLLFLSFLIFQKKDLT